MSNERVIELLEELLDWTKFANREALKSMLQDVLKHGRHFDAYVASNGANSQKFVGEASGLSQQSISRLWATWGRLGIVRSSEEGVRHLADPRDLGLERPDDAVAAGKEASSHKVED